MPKLKVAPPRPDDSGWALTEHVTRLVNALFRRRLRASRSLYDAITEALDAGYREDELRVVPWVARCLFQGWITGALARDLPPEILYRFKGGMNPKSGQPARRWLDELLARAGEVAPDLVSAKLRDMPEDMREGEKALLTRMAVTFEEER